MNPGIQGNRRRKRDYQQSSGELQCGLCGSEFGQSSSSDVGKTDDATTYEGGGHKHQLQLRPSTLSPCNRQGEKRTKLGKEQHSNLALVSVTTVKDEAQVFRDDTVSWQQEVGIDPVDKAIEEASKIFAQQEDCSGTVTSQYRFVGGTAECQSSSKATLNHCQSRARSGKEHEKLQLHKKSKGVIPQEDVELKSVGFPENASSYEERFGSTIVETKRERLKRAKRQGKMVFTLAHLDESRRIIEGLFPLKDFEDRVHSWDGEVGLTGRLDPLILLEELKDIYGVNLVSFSAFPVKKHMEKDGWHSYCTKIKLEQVLVNLQCQNALLEAEMEQVKCRLGSNQHFPHDFGKVEQQPDLSAILPLECIAHIISFTSPLDACRLSLVCHAFCAAAAMDAVWEKFLPSDYDDNILHSNSLSAKEKFHHLCRKPAFLDERCMSFALDRRTGKKILVIRNPPRMISVSGEIRRPLRFGYMDEMESKLLSPRTAYVVYLIFRFAKFTYGLDKALVELLVHHDGGGARESRLVLLEPPEDMDEVPKERADGLKEIVMGEFFNDYGDGGAAIQFCLRKRLFEFRQLLHGLVINRIEFRPKVVDIR